MNEGTEIKEAARERLFDAVLAEAVAAASTGAPPRRGRQLALVATLLLAVIATLGVALLKVADHVDEAQDPAAFDPLFPSIEREFHRDRLHVQLRSVERVGELPEGPLPPLAVLPMGPTGEGPVPLAVLHAVIGRSGVRSLTIAGASAVPKASWRDIAAMPDLEALTICCEIDAECLRELRHAPRLRALCFGRTMSGLDKYLVAAVLELPRLDSLSLVWQKVPSAELAALGGLPELRSLYMEGCSMEPDWLDAHANLRTLRWLSIAFGPLKNETLTAVDLRRFGALPRLESLSLTKADIEAGDYAALPASLQVVSLPGPVPAAVVRELLLRPKLRGISLGPLEPEAESVLCELLPTTKLERFGYFGRTSEPLWLALEGLPQLRHLTFSAGKNVGAEIQRVTGLKNLEHLSFQASVPPADQLRCLRELPKLRRLVISGIGDASEYQADLDALQQAVGPNVHLIVN